MSERRTISPEELDKFVGDIQRRYPKTLEALRQSELEESSAEPVERESSRDTT